MSNKQIFWMAIGIAIGIATGVASKNIHAAIFIGSGAGMLLIILTNLETDKKIRN
jgi:hypothetical protein